MHKWSVRIAAAASHWLVAAAVLSAQESSQRAELLRPLPAVDFPEMMLYSGVAGEAAVQVAVPARGGHGSVIPGSARHSYPLFGSALAQFVERAQFRGAVREQQPIADTLLVTIVWELPTHPALTVFLPDLFLAEMRSSGSVQMVLRWPTRSLYAPMRVDSSLSAEIARAVEAARPAYLARSREPTSARWRVTSVEPWHPTLVIATVDGSEGHHVHCAVTRPSPTTHSSWLAHCRNDIWRPKRSPEITPLPPG
jgi:hypothetical protein